MATKRNYIEILSFKHFHKHFVFVDEGEKTRNKVLKNHITVSVVIDLGVGTQQIKNQNIVIKNKYVLKILEKKVKTLLWKIMLFYKK